VTGCYTVHHYYASFSVQVEGKYYDFSPKVDLITLIQFRYIVLDQLQSNTKSSHLNIIVYTVR